MNSIKYNAEKSTPSPSSRLRNSIKPNQGFTIVQLLIVVVVIAILAAITIVAYNGITNRAKDSAKASELSSWKKKAELRKVGKSITCPDNYSFVYGIAALGTDDFCVMKYEAKNVGGVATSQAVGTPWVSISQTDAIAASTAAGGHLLTDAEWMTIAADVLSVKYNWSGGEVGSGITGWGATKGVGSIYAGYADTGSRAFIRGGSSGNGAFAGVLALALNVAPSHMAASIGFRVAR